MECIIKHSWKLAKKGLAASCTVIFVVHCGSGDAAWTLHPSCSSAGCKGLILLGELLRRLHVWWFTTQVSLHQEAGCSIGNQFFPS